MFAKRKKGKKPEQWIKQNGRCSLCGKRRVCIRFVDDERRWWLCNHHDWVTYRWLAGFSEPIGLVTLRALLKSALRSEGESSRFLSGGITFCQMQPLRSIPFRVICLLGLNDEVFPRSDRRPGFHRMAFGSERRRGDRSLRDDDRYLFLEALLDAREHLRLSYVGRSVRDNRVLPPSVVLGDLFDALHEGFLPETGGASREALEARLATQHPLHAFSPRYFGAGPRRRLMPKGRPSRC